MALPFFPEDEDPMAFPLTFIPPESWTEPPRSFAARRDGGARKHAGCDLYAAVGTPVFAVADGTVQRFAEFYLDTYALVIDHGGFIVRYGEIKKDIAEGLPIGAKVKKGQQIGLVGRLTGLAISMVHFEMYDGSGSGPLTDRNRAPFMRRADLIDPTSHLNAWAKEPLPVA
jgi:murein DD-endopeptidase MepM/ murein hydrolase activator NlpD